MHSTNVSTILGQEIEPQRALLGLDPKQIIFMIHPQLVI